MKHLNSLLHKQPFYSTGTYSIKENTIDLATEIPNVELSYKGNSHKLGLKHYYDISSDSIPCMLAIYSHGHPTDREKLPIKDLDWDKKTLKLDNVFKSSNFPQSKILVITLHDEDFEDEHKAIYRFFVKHHVIFDANSKTYDLDIKSLQEFINGKLKNYTSNEEPRTVGGGVIDPA